MPKHNIYAIAAATIAAHDAYWRHEGPVAAPPVAPQGTLADDSKAFEERLAAERVRVLEAIHGEPTKDQAGGTEDERRADRLFSAIVKALTVRL